MRVLLITHADTAFDPNRYTNQLVVALGEIVDLVIADWDQMPTPSVRAAAANSEADLSTVDAVLFYVRFRNHLGTPFDWTGFSGLRVWFEQDAWIGYSSIFPPWRGQFAPMFLRNRFDLMITSGRHTRDLLAADGVRAAWVPKGFNGPKFSDLGRPRAGSCTYSLNWPSRRAMLHRLQRGGVELADVSGPYDTLNDRLNGYATAVVCNMPGRPRFGKLGRGAHRIWPEFTRVEPAIEPMIKTFESAAAGCALVVDDVPELEELGFVHGETCLTYSTFEEAMELIRETPHDEMVGIGRRGSQVAHAKHTWRHRAPQVVELLQ